MLHIPPSAERATRIIAPIAFVALALDVRTSARKGVTLSCSAESVDRVVPNPALVAWIRQQVGKDLEITHPEEEGVSAFEIIASLVKSISKSLDITEPAESSSLDQLVLVPRVDDLGDSPSIIWGAVIGLFPVANQSLLADTRWMIDRPDNDLQGPVRSFLKPEATGAPLARENGISASEVETSVRVMVPQRLITQADPCQAEAVRRAQFEPAIVIHGPPGTGKSQTIANIIGDHAARGQRVLFVCDKRTALDVVKSRLNSLGLGALCALIHDPKKEQKGLYMGLRERLDALVDEPRVQDPSRELEECDHNLEAIHSELSSFYHSLHGVTEAQEASFHQLFGDWLELASAIDLPREPGSDGLRLQEVENARTRIEEILARANRVSYLQNPWKRRLELSVKEYLQMTDGQIAASFGSANRPGI